MCTGTNSDCIVFITSYTYIVSRRRPSKKGSGETVYKKFSVRNFDWMTFTGYVSVMPASIQPDPLEVIKA